MNSINIKSHPILVKTSAGYHQHTARGWYFQVAHNKALLPIIITFMKTSVSICLPGKLVYGEGKSYK